MSCEESDEKMAWKVGPVGPEEEGSIFDDGVHSAVKQLVIYYTSYIKCIHIEYDDNGSSIWSDEHGLPTFWVEKTPYLEKDTIKLDYPDEFFITVSGHYKYPRHLQTSICSLTFKSNKKSYGPYGQESGNSFFLGQPAHKIVGFHGRDDICMGVDAIGAYLKPIDHYQNDKCHPSKLLNHTGSSVLPTVKYPSKLLLPSEYPRRTKVISEDDDKANRRISCIISGNQVSGSEGNHNGTFAVANKYKFNINTHYYYYIGNSNAM